MTVVLIVKCAVPFTVDEFMYTNWEREEPHGNGEDCLNLYENQAGKSIAGEKAH